MWYSLQPSFFPYPRCNPQREIRPQQFMIGNDETELELSVESRSFLNRVNDQARKRSKRSSMDVTEDGEKHSKMWRTFMSVTMESVLLMGKNYLNNCHSIANTKKPHIETNVRHICKIVV